MFDHILVPMDGSPLAECVLPHVVAMATAFQSRVTLMQVLSLSESAGQFVDPLDWQIGKVQARNYLEEQNHQLQQAGLQTSFTLLDGQAASSIIEYARGNGVNLIILSSHGRSGLSIWNVSGVVHKIIQRAHLPSMIIRAYHSHDEPSSAPHYRTILVPLDFSQRAECALPVAARLARHFSARLVAAHVVVRPEMPRCTAPTAEDLELAARLVERNRVEAEKYLRQLDGRYASQDIHIETRLLVRDNAASALHKLVEQEHADLVVMSAHGYSGETYWPHGNVVEKFILYGSTPLLIYQDFSPEELRPSEAETVVARIKGR